MGSTEFFLFPCWFDPDFGPDVTTGRAVFHEQDFSTGTKGIDIRLRMSPQSVKDKLIAWKDVEVDVHHDIDSRGMTSVGPTFPDGDYKGCLAMSTTFLGTLDPKDSRTPTLPPEDYGAYVGREYEFKTVQYWDDNTQAFGNRFYGFHAKIDGANLVIWDMAMSLDATAPPKTIPLASFDWNKCDPVANKHSTIQKGDNAGTEGALFIESMYARATLGMRAAPKFPKSYGVFSARLKQTDLVGEWEAGLERILLEDVNDLELTQQGWPVVAAFLDAHRFDPLGRGYSLDLIGHSVGSEHLLEVNGVELDAKMVTELAAYFQSPEFKASSIRRIRLLGCNTAKTDLGKTAIVALAQIAGVPVYGTKTKIDNHHFGPHGFREEFENLLVSDSALNGTFKQQASVEKRAAGVVVSEKVQEGWFEPFVDLRSKQLRAPILARPDAILRRRDGSKHSEVYVEEREVRTFGTHGAGPSTVYDVKDVAGLRAFIAGL